MEPMKLKSRKQLASIEPMLENCRQQPDHRQLHPPHGPLAQARQSIRQSHPPPPANCWRHAPTLHTAALAQGFSTNALVMDDAILNTWQLALDQPGILWPTNEMSQWIMEKVAARKPNDFLAVGFIFPSTNGNSGSEAVRSPPSRVSGTGSLSALSDELANQGFILSGWELLGSSILHRVQQNLWKVVVPMVLLVLLSLWLAFRRPKEILLSIAVPSPQRSLSPSP